MDAFMESFNKELVESGELVDARGLTAPVHTRRVQLAGRRPGGDRRAVRRDPGGARRLHDRRVRELRPGDRDRRPARELPGARAVAADAYADVRPIVDVQRRPGGLTAPCADTEVEDLLRRLAPQVLGAVVRRYGHFDTAEDAVQEALLAAATQWPTDGIPDNPRGWLITVASRRLTDLLRSEQARRRREDTVARWTLPDAVAGARRRPAGRPSPTTR